MAVKEFLTIALTVLIFASSLCACNKIVSQDDSRQGDKMNKNNTSHNEGIITDVFDFNAFDGTENQAIFSLLVKDNPIDEAYFSEPANSTTKEMVELQLKYANIWCEELEFSCENLTKLLNDSDREIFQRLQSEWEINLKGTRDFINNVFINGEYDVHMGSTFPIECAYKYMESLRERTLYVKYLQYSLETNSSAETKVSVDFLYK